MIPLHRLALVLALLSMSYWSVAQDRNLSNNVIYPEGAFAQFTADTTRIEGSGRVVDVTRPPFSATGDGVTDDTEALIAAYTFVTDRLREFTRNDSLNRASYLLYFPSGTYLVSNTIIHEGELAFDFPDSPLDTYEEGAAQIRMVGQNRENTIIRLKNNCPGFEAGANRAVVSFQKPDVGRREGTNTPGSNQLSDITVNTGSGNPGAVGVLYLGANISEIRNVTITSEDGQGAIGLDMPVPSVQGYYHDITVEGFDYGITSVDNNENNPTLEYVTLSNQNSAGVLVVNGSPSMRRLLSTNAGPAVQMISNQAHVVLIDSELQGGDASAAAIDYQDTLSQLFARNVQTEGYASAIRRAGTDVVSGTIDEYVSGRVFSLFEQAEPRSLNLPVAESPVLAWEQDTAQWANVDDYPGATDSEKIQNAMNSGRSTVYFPGSFYNIEVPIAIPTSVRHIDFMYSRPNFGAGFTISDGASDTLFMDHIDGRGILTQSAPRAVVLRHLSLQRYHYTAEAPSRLFVESCANVADAEDFCPPPLSIWARSINEENKQTSNIKVYGGTMWALGYKTEGQQASFDVNGGGSLEVLGGYRNETEPDEGFPIVINDNANVSFVGYTNLRDPYELVITETQSGITRSLRLEDVPKRPFQLQNRGVNRAPTVDIYVPLYVGRVGATTPVLLTPTALSSAPSLTEAQLFWNQRNAVGTTYEVRYRALDATDWITLSSTADTTLTLNGLRPVTSYQWQVRATVDSTGSASEWSASATFATALPAQQVSEALTIDGSPDEATWQIDIPIAKQADGTPGTRATFGVLWDETNLYVAARVLDSTLFNDSEAVFQDDGVEVYLDVNNNDGAYDSTDNQLILGYQDDSLFTARSFSGTIQFATDSIEGGYAVEFAIPWAGLGISPEADFTLGFDIGVNDDQDGGNREGQQVWAGASNNFATTANFGNVVLLGTPTSTTTEVIVTARGATGEEQFELLLDSQRVGAIQTATTSLTDYTFTVDQAGTYRVVFINDGRSANDQDKNLLVDKITVDGEVFESEDQAVNTGNWSPDVGCGGGGPAEWLYCNGYIEYEQGESEAALNSKGPTVEVNLRIYPNASQGTFYLESPEAQSLRVVNAMGQPLEVQVLKPGRKNIVDITSQPAGVYLFQVLTPHGMVVHRVLKQ